MCCLFLYTHCYHKVSFYKNHSLEFFPRHRVLRFYKDVGLSPYQKYPQEAMLGMVNYPNYVQQIHKACIKCTEVGTEGDSNVVEVLKVFTCMCRALCTASVRA